jgi:hypothetical protein
MNCCGTFLILLIIGAAIWFGGGSILYIVAGEIGRRKPRADERALRRLPRQERLDTDIANILDRVEGLAPLWEIAHFSHDTNTNAYPPPRWEIVTNWSDYSDLPLNNTVPWTILVTFRQNTNDGVLETRVLSHPGLAVVRVALRGTELVSRKYHDPTSDRQPRFLLDFFLSIAETNSTANPITVRHVRTWVREKMQSEIEAANTRRELEKQRRESEERQREAHVDAMRKKYLSEPMIITHLVKAQTMGG